MVRRRRPSALTAASWADGPFAAGLPGSLRSVTPEGRAAAAELLGRLGAGGGATTGQRRQAIDALSALKLNDPDSAVRSAATRALAAFTRGSER